MKVKTFWIILLKCLGIWLAYQILLFIPQLSMLYYYLREISVNVAVIVPFLVMLIGYGIFLGVCFLFLFRTEYLFEKLRLAKDIPQENLELNYNPTGIIQVGIILLAGVMFVDNLPLLIRYTYTWLNYSDDSSLNYYTLPTDTFLYACKVVIAYFLFTNSAWVARKLEGVRKKPAED